MSDMTNGIAIHELLATKDREIAELRAKIDDLDAKQQILANFIKTPDGVFTFPDGDYVQTSVGTPVEEMQERFNDLREEHDRALALFVACRGEGRDDALSWCWCARVLPSQPHADYCLNIQKLLWGAVPKKGTPADPPPGSTGAPR